MRKYIVSAIMVCVSLVALAQNKITTEEYIHTYREIAVIEMHRTGIPASITLAQGILESGSGNSRLATEAKNHFGIKCHKGWTGPSISMDDDAKGECFRKYKDALESYLDHSEFLQTRSRYSFLFELDRTDYNGWAHGLKKAGYATNPRYAQLLIGLIERYELDQYDRADKTLVFADKGKVSTKEKEDDKAAEKESAKSKISYTNRIRTVYLQPGQTLADISNEYNVREKKLRKYNEIDEGHELTAGMKVFLQPKRRKGDAKFHKVKEGESMYSISQIYGIKMKFLYKRNLMEEGEEPAKGERLYLRKNRKKAPKLRSGVIEKPAPAIVAKPGKEDAEEELVFIGEEKEVAEPVKTSNKKPAAAKTVEPKYSYHGTVSDAGNVGEGYIFHTVQEKETLYSLSRKYGTTVEQLQEWNDLADNNIKIGQSIIVGLSK